MKFACYWPRYIRGCFVFTSVSFYALAGSAPGADQPVPSSSSEAAAQPVLSLPAAVNVSVPLSAPTDPKPRLPLSYSDFAADYHSPGLRPDWLAVQVGTLETIFTPPPGKTMFVLPELKPELTANFQHQEFTALIGAKCRFDNFLSLDTDPLGHPLGYSLPLGRLIYFLAREANSSGIYFSLHYYDSSQLRWLPSGETQGAFVPATEATVVTQDLTAPLESYVFIYLSTRMGNQRPGSTSRPLQLYNYLVVHLHHEAPPAVAAATGIVAPPVTPKL